MEIKAINEKLYVVSKTSVLVLDTLSSRYFNILANDILVVNGYVYLASKGVVKVSNDYFNLHLEKHPTLNLRFGQEILTKSILDYNAYAVCQGANETVYFGTQNGLFCERNDAVFDCSIISGQLRLSVNDLAYDPVENLLFVATSGNGLVILKGDHVVATLTIRNGLSGDNVQSLLLDEDHVLWIGTSNSIDRLYLDEKEKPKVDNFGVVLNIGSTRIRDIEIVDRKLYLATDYGVIEHPLNIDLINPSLPQMMLNSFSVNAVDQSFDNQMGPVLQYYENAVSFGFVGILYKSLGNLQYQYQLKGFQHAWHTTKNNNVTFEALPPGDYTFSVRAINSSGLKGNTVNFAFVISQPFWQTIWFIGLLVLLIVGGIFLILFFRIRRIRAHFELERKIIESEVKKLEFEKSYLIAEQRAGVLQMNPHFLFNSLNTIKGFYAQNKFIEANRFISRFSRLLRRILECNTQFITLEKELEILDLYLDLMQKRYDGLFEYSVHSELKKCEHIFIPPMMIQPLVENAVIHGVTPLLNGKVEVRFYIENEFFICTVVDNGIGFTNTHNQTHQSVGIENIKDRLRFLAKQSDADYSFVITSPNEIENCIGTTVKIQFPIKIIKYESNNNR